MARIWAAGSLIVRWRRARGVERQQLKWLAYAAAMLVVAQVGASLLPRALFLVVTMVTTVLFPAATGIAVVRYRLYEIDRLINRTLVYGLLTATLGPCVCRAGAGAGPAARPGLRLGGGRRHPGRGRPVPAGPPPHPAGRRPALQPPPLRRRRDRRGLSLRLRDQVELDTLSAELLTVVDQTMQPTAASLWLSPSSQAMRRGQR